MRLLLHRLFESLLYFVLKYLTSLCSVPNLPSTIKNLILLSILIISGKARSGEARNTENFAHRRFAAYAEHLADSPSDWRI